MADLDDKEKVADKESIKESFVLHKKSEDDILCDDPVALTTCETPPDSCVGRDDSKKPLSSAELRRYAESDTVFQRLLAARYVRDTLKANIEDEFEVHGVFAVICSLFDDPDGIVRAEILEHLPRIAILTDAANHYIEKLVHQLLVPFVLKLLEDSEPKVQQGAQDSLIFFIQHGLINHTLYEDIVRPQVIQLATKESSDECRLKAVTLVCEMLGLVRDHEKKSFVLPFLHLSQDGFASVREACARGMEKFVGVSMGILEAQLFPRLLELCTDECWIVRRACPSSLYAMASDMYEYYSCLNLLDSYVGTASRALLKLLGDDSRCVRQSAFKYVGKFIALYVPSSQLEASSESEFDSCSESEFDSCAESEDENSDSIDTNSSIDRKVFAIKRLSCSSRRARIRELDLLFKRKLEYAQDSDVESNKGNVPLCTETQHCNDICKNNNCSSRNATQYSSFYYWRLPLPEVEIDSGIVNQADSSFATELKFDEDDVCDNRTQSPSASLSAVFHKRDSQVPAKREFKESAFIVKTSDHQLSNRRDSPPSSTDTISQARNCCKVHRLKRQHRTSRASSCGDNQNLDFLSPYEQDVVSVELLEKYVSLVDPVIYESDLAVDCAYTFPAVAKTLGRKYWPCLRKLCKVLAHDMQWQVRKTLASSLHELAVILGPELSSRDLVPLFLKFLEDVDEVQLGVMKNFTKFLQHTGASSKSQLLPKIISRFIKLTGMNWRLRETIAKKLISWERSFHLSDIYGQILPLALQFLKDKVCAVREQAIHLVALMLRRLPCKSCEWCDLIATLKKEFRESDVWRWRQMYVYLCLMFAKKRSVRHYYYGSEFGYPLLGLAQDMVPNVRIALARCLAELPQRHMSSLKDHNPTVLCNAIVRLQSDSEKDVNEIAQRIQEGKDTQRKPLIFHKIPRCIPNRKCISFSMEDDGSVSQDGSEQ